MLMSISFIERMKVKQIFIIFICYTCVISGNFHRDSSSEWNRKYRKPEGRYTRDIEEYEIVVPQKVNEDSSFWSYILPHFHDKAHKQSSDEKDKSHSATKRNNNEHKVHYKVAIGGKDHHLELFPNWNFISPNLVLEVRGRRESGSTTKVKMRQIADEHNCHYNGVVRGHPNSLTALSLCDGLVGYIKTSDNNYFIEPLKDEVPTASGEHLHIIYKRGSDFPASAKGTCGTSDDWERAWKERLTREALHRMERRNSSSGSKRSTSQRNFIETLVVADRKFMEYHKGMNIENYILTIMNMVSGLFHDASIGNQIDVIIVRIMLLETEKDEMDLDISPKSEKTLKSFCSWQSGMNPKINHPNHHDVAVLLTRHDLCAEGGQGGSCDLLGLAYVAAACVPEKSCCINEDNGLILGITVAHEMGHVMGCSHDDPAVSGCNPKSGNGFYNVMSPIVVMTVNMWSKCSRKYVTELIDNNLGECLANEPADHKFEVTDEMLPGAVYDADIQCSWQHGQNSKVCITDQNKLCERLYCNVNRSCYSYGYPPADGTPCGSKKWCYQKKCVEVGSRPEAVNGGWGVWSPASECSRTCGGGAAVSERECDNPKPNHKGRYCIGPRKRYTICNTKKCPPNKPTFRELQCSGRNSIEYQGKLHTWKPYIKPGGNPCELVCLNEGNKFAKLQPAVKDGTPCKPGTRNLCLGGICRKVGCDWRLDSNAVEDVCGVCNGDGTHCKLVEGTFTQLKGNGYVEITTIPAQSTNIIIEELDATENTLAISSQDHKTFYLNGNNKEETDGEFSFGKNTIGIYSHTEPQQEELVIKGPTTEDLILYDVFYGNDNPGIKYKYYEPIKGAVRTPSYHWEFVQWESCSVDCGGGTRISKAKCIEEESGEVSDSFCSLIPKPETKQEECNPNPCPTRWIAGPWKKCNACDGKKGFQIRDVECMKIIGNGEEEMIADRQQCKGKPPHGKQSCTSKKPCHKKRKGKPKLDLHVGEIAKDPVPKSQNQLIKVPIIPKGPGHLSDEAYEDLGDQVPDKIDEKKAEVIKGNEAKGKKN